MGEGRDAALGLGIIKRFIQDEDFEDYQPRGGPSAELIEEEADKKSSNSGDDDEGGEGGEDKCEVVNEEIHGKVYVDGNSTSNKNAMTPTRKEGDKMVRSDKKTRGGKGKFQEKPSRKSLRKRNAPTRY